MFVTTKPCSICRKNEYMNRDGFFFCVECGTQAENVLETAQEDTFLSEAQRLSRRKKIKSTKENELELTSWECVNYILVGLVNELNNLGAKDELKLKAFQVWAEFLRKNGIAFFKSKACSLPKLSASYKPRDAKVIFNHHIQKRKRKRSKADNMNSASYKRQKAKYAKSEYEKSLTETDISLTTIMSSTSDLSSSRAIKLDFTYAARKILKKTIRPGHLQRHENDYTKNMDCNCIPIKKDNVLYRKRTDQLFNRKTVYAILYIALNLIDDNIQLYDLVRFIKSGNLSSRKFSHFFPDNIRDSCDKIVSSIDFPKAFDQTGISIRRQAAVVCHLLSINQLIVPNLNKLTTRFCKDFMLPEQIAVYVERLINFCPPKMNYISDVTPFYEGRVLAYLIFVLKLLFGLDDIKEEIISNSAKQINKILEIFLERKKLFVFKDWMKYIEVRKLILSRYNLCYFETFKNFKNLDTYLENMARQDEYEEVDIGFNRGNVLNMSHIFDLYSKDFKGSQPFLKLNFVTFTPQLDYFERILYDPPEDVLITKLLKEDYSVTDIKPFINPKNLKKYLKEKNFRLNIREEKRNKNLTYVDTFSYKSRKMRDSEISLRGVNFVEKGDRKNLNKKNYSKILDVEFLKPIDVVKGDDNSASKQKSSSKHKSKNEVDLKNVKNPFLPGEETNIFSELSDDLFSSEDNTFNSSNHIKDIKFVTSNMDYWILHGKLDIRDEDFKNVKEHMPRNFLWLLETFASYLETDIELLYNELLIIESYYFYKLEDINKIKSILLHKELNVQETCSQFTEHFSRYW